MLTPGEAHRLVISYKADGASSFSYGLAHNQRTNLDLVVTVQGLPGSSVPRTSLPATANERDGEGDAFAWQYTGLIADRDIQLTLPTRLSLAQRVAQLQDDFVALAGLAPFLVGLFLITLFGLLRQSEATLRLEGYVLIGCGVALFYPLLTFLSGLVDLTLAAILAFLLVAGLLMVFLGLAVGWRKIWWRVSLLSIIFLGIFSLGMLTPWRGLLLTFGGLLLIGTFMLLYARRPVKMKPETSPLLSIETNLERDHESTSKETQAEPDTLHCPYCARALADDHNFCPGCGHETNHLCRCEQCGYQQFIPAEVELTYCLRCGAALD